MKDTNKTYIYFWENNGKIIERINIPIKPASGQKKTIYEVYEANEALRMVKLGFDDGNRYICVNEQPKYLKIMDSTSSKL